jgi:hypothetical protein
MIDVLYNKLQSIDDADLVEWKDFEQSIFSKHVQFYKGLHQELPIESVVHAVTAVTAVPVVPAVPAVPVITRKEESCIAPILLENKKDIPRKRENLNKKEITIKPLDIINKETISFNNSTEYIKDKLITLISREEFSKIFGITKCAEIMSGIVNNRWNKATALFISFLFDKEVYYNDNIVIYNKEKNNGRITIAKV